MASGDTKTFDDHAVVSHEDWLKARAAFLAREKEFTQQRDALARERRALPWERVDKPYTFEGPGGRATLAELFGDRSQLVVYQFMFGPKNESGCPHCSFWADSFNPNVIHLAQRDVTMVAVSRAPLDRIEAFRKRMGWTFPWLSSAGSDYNYDFQASFRPADIAAGRVYYNYRTGADTFEDREGLSAFYKNPRGEIFHTYSTYARGIDILNTAYNILDMAPKGRDEDGLEFTQAWVRHHDRYDR
jgi:predicted dithiol-disulfide oxidoreductase (DUF899 family)